MSNQKKSGGTIKSNFGNVRQQRRLAEFDRVKSLRRQYANELSLLRDSLNSSVCGVIITDLDGCIRYVNNSFLRLYEYGGKADIYGKNIADLFASDKVGTFAHVKAIIDCASGEAEEFEMLCRNGTCLSVEVCASYVTDSHGNVVGRMASFFDITQRKQAQEEKRKLQVRLQEPQSLEIIAGLAGVIADELNNVLQGIIGHFQMMKEDVDEHIGVKEFAENMEAQMKRLLELTKELLAVAKGGELQPEKVTVNNLVSETPALIRHPIPTDRSTPEL